MNPSHYPSFEICKKLTSIGFPKTSIHYYGTMDWRIFDDCAPVKAKYVRPSVMELIDTIPKWQWVSVEQDWGFMVWPTYSEEGEEWVFIDNKLPEALAKYVLWLHEQKLLTL